MRKFISVLVSLLLGFSSFLPLTANAQSNYTQIDNNSPGWESVSGGARINVDGYDVAAVKQATFLVVWTREPVTDQGPITTGLRSVPGSQSTTNTVYSAGSPRPGKPSLARARPGLPVISAIIM